MITNGTFSHDSSSCDYCVDETETIGGVEWMIHHGIVQDDRWSEDSDDETETDLSCDYCAGDDTHTRHSVCPRCESVGFDHQGHIESETVRYYQLQCWECGLQFAVEVNPDE